MVLNVIHLMLSCPLHIGHIRPFENAMMHVVNKRVVNFSFMGLHGLILKVVIGRRLLARIALRDGTGIPTTSMRIEVSCA